jgi:predicted  nucleic acid-binding Zn-ribbon protein
VWRKEDELKALKSELSTVNRKIELSLKPIDQSEDKPDKKQGDEQSPKPELTETEKAVQEIHALFSGKLKATDFTNNLKKMKV